jgi:hypothetical protein
MVSYREHSEAARLHLTVKKVRKWLQEYKGGAYTPSWSERLIDIEQNNGVFDRTLR